MKHETCAVYFMPVSNGSMVTAYYEEGGHLQFVLPGHQMNDKGLAAAKEYAVKHFADRRMPKSDAVITKSKEKPGKTKTNPLIRKRK